MPNGIIHLDPVMTKAGEYGCTVCKKAPPRSGGYPRTWKWKTLRGYQNHECYTQILEGQSRAEMQAQKRREEDAERLAAHIATCPRKVGDVVCAVTYIVTEPTHRSNGRRMVRYRYEEKRRYMAVEKAISAILLHGYRLGLCTVVRECDIHPTFSEAQNAADVAQKAYDDACEFAASCR